MSRGNRKIKKFLGNFTSVMDVKGKSQNLIEVELNSEIYYLPAILENLWNFVKESSYKSENLINQIHLSPFLTLICCINETCSFFTSFCTLRGNRIT